MWKVKANYLLLQVVTELLTFRHPGGTEASDSAAIKPFNLRLCCQDPAFALELVVTCPHSKAVQILICSVQLPAALKAATNKPQSLQGFQWDSEYSQVWETDWHSSNTKSELLRFWKMVKRQEKLKLFSYTVVTSFSMPPILPLFSPVTAKEAELVVPPCFFCIILSHSSGRKSRVYFQCQTHFCFPITRRTVLKRYFTLPNPKGRG